MNGIFLWPRALRFGRLGSLLGILLFCFSALPLRAEFSYQERDGSVIITRYTGPETTLVIPSIIDNLPITSIGDWAFLGCVGLTSVTIPNSVTNIGSYAFSSCMGLTSVTIPSSLTSIGNNAFQYCSGLTSLIIPSSVTSIGDWAFWGCVSLTSVTIPNSVTNIGSYAFIGCMGLTSVSVDPRNTVYSSLDGVLLNKDQTNLIVFPAARKGVYAIPNSVISIGDGAFQYCSGLTSLTIPSSVTSIGNYAFQGCSGLTSLIIPSSVTSIGDSAFWGCRGLTSLTIPSSVTSIGNSAFLDCSGLTSLTIPSSVTSISNSAFSGCSGLTSLTIPSSVTSIDYTAFRYCSGLISVSVDPRNTAYSSLDGVLLNKDRTNIIVFPAAKKGEYVIPSGVTSIGNLAFSGCSGLTSVTIPNSVTNIGSYAFSGCNGLTSVTIPSSVTSIGDNAFQYCSGLTSLTIPSSVTSIGHWAFLGCVGLTSVTIPNSVTNIGSYAFSGCSGLTSLTIPSSVTSIGGAAFQGCSGLTSINVEPQNSAYSSLDGVLLNKDQTNLILFPARKNGPYTIPGSVTSIRDSTFQNCSELTSITIPNSVNNIGNYAFQYCYGLTSLIIPNSVTSIGNSAFSECSGLTSLTIPNSVTSIGDSAFSGCSGLTSLTIPSSVTSIGSNAFQYCSGLTSLTIPSSVTSIGSNAFQYCAGLTSLTIPSSVTSIGNQAFGGCSGLASLNIPSSVTSIGDWAFQNCSGLTSVHVDPLNTAYLSLDGVLLSKDQTNLILFPAAKKGAYVIPSGVTSIRDSTFQNCSGLTSITIPNSVTSIGNSAFWGCSGLTRLTIPGSVTSISNSAFQYCGGLTSLTVDPKNPNYSSLDGVLLNRDQTNLILSPVGKKGTYTIPDSVTNIGDGAFGGCRELTSVTIPNTVTSIGKNAFQYCIGLTSLTLPSSITSIEENAFGNCSGLKSITIPSSVTSIGKTAFQYCSGLTSLIIPSNVTSIEENAFGNCRGLMSLIIPSSVTSIGFAAFYNCSGLTSVTIPSSVTSIGGYAFWGCSGLKSVAVDPQNIGYSSLDGVLLNKDQTNLILFPKAKKGSYTIPSGVTSIGVETFQNCSGLTGIIIPSSVTSIGEGAFQNCSGLTSLIIPSSVTSIGFYAFQGCSGLTSLTIPSGVTSIGAAAFQGCSGLTSVTIPRSVTSIGDGAFRSCSGLTSVTVEPQNAAYSSLDGVLLNKDQTNLILFPAQKIGSYTIPNRVTSIADGAFWLCSGISSVTIPNRVTSIGDYAFQGCSGLTSVTVEPQNTAFSSLDGILLNKDQTNLVVFPAGKKGPYTIPNSVTSIGAGAFLGCSGLTSVTIPGSVTSIGDWAAFSGCGGLTSITVAPQNTAYSSLDGVLLNKDQTKLVAYPAGKKGPYTIPDSVTNIEDGAFWGCNGLTSLTIPSSVTSVAYFAFSACTSLRSLIFKGNAPALGQPPYPFFTNLYANPLGSIGAPDFKIYYFADKTGPFPPLWPSFPTVRVPIGKGVYLLSGPSDSTVLQGGAAQQNILIDNFGNGGNSSATYALLAASGTAIATGPVPNSGQLSLPLRAVSASGYYTLRITRTYIDGTTSSVDSSAFHVDLKSWAEFAGVYEMMLEDVNGLIGDGARYRGKLVATITKTGSVSGRIFYNEAPHLDAVDSAQSPAWSMRAYTPVIRTFAARFAAGGDDVLQVVCTPRLGVGTTANRQSLTLSVDFSATPVQLNAEVHDFVSLPIDSTRPDGAICSGSATASLINLRAVPVAGTPQSVNLSAITASRYAVVSNAPQTGQTDPSSDNNAYILIQTLPSGRLIWTTRMTGYTGSGSGYLKLSDPSASNCLEVPLYESRSISNTLQLNATSLLGELRLRKDDATDSWSAQLQNGATEDSLERQTSYVTKGLLNGKLSPVYSAIAFNQDGTQPSAFSKSFNWSGVSSLEFSDQNYTAWSPLTGVFGLQPSLTKAPLYLSADDPVTGENYVWILSVSSTGLVRAAKYLPGDSSQPALTMRLDRARGEWTGSYVDPSKIRRNLFGVIVPLGGDQDPSAQGWIEAGVFPGMCTGAWSLAH